MLAAQAKVTMQNETGLGLFVKADGNVYHFSQSGTQTLQLGPGYYPSEKASTLMADFTFTVRLAKSIFLPFELKYNPKNGNLFGFLSVKWDFLRTSDKSNK